MHRNEYQLVLLENKDENKEGFGIAKTFFKTP
jgi:hypothetical protein